jgi:hypothetical protein
LKNISPPISFILDSSNSARTITVAQQQDDAMAALAKKSPADRLDVDGWRSVLQFLSGNEIATVTGISKSLQSACGKGGVWTNIVCTVTLPSSSYADVQKWRLPGKEIVIKGEGLADSADSASFQEAIHAILSNANSSNLQNLALLQIPATLPVIRTLVKALQGRALARLTRPLKRLVWEIKWIDSKRSWDCGRMLMEGLITVQMEEIEFRWLQVSVYDTEMHYHYRDAVLDLLSYNDAILKFTLPGCLWADTHSDGMMNKALANNTTVQSLTFKAPHFIRFWEYIERDDGKIGSFARMLVHPSLRHLSIADRVAPEDPSLVQNSNQSYFTSLYFANPEDFPKSTLETLHIELGRESSGGLLAVLHCVADMPQLQRLTVSWPTGHQSAPQEISMKLLREFLQANPLQIYRERPKYSYGYDLLFAPVPWSTLSTLFVVADQESTQQ